MRFPGWFFGCLLLAGCGGGGGGGASTPAAAGGPTPPPAPSPLVVPPHAAGGLQRGIQADGTPVEAVGVVGESVAGSGTAGTASIRHGFYPGTTPTPPTGGG